MHQKAIAHDGIERPGREGQPLEVGADVSVLRRPLRGHLEHRGGNIEPGDAQAERCEQVRQDPRTAWCVEHRAAGGDFLQRPTQAIGERTQVQLAPATAVAALFVAPHVDSPIAPARRIVSDVGRFVGAHARTVCPPG
jgi:hypothetical protein